jgi:hypothetical protein
VVSQVLLHEDAEFVMIWDCNQLEITGWWLRANVDLMSSQTCEQSKFVACSGSDEQIKMLQMTVVA